VATLVSAVHDLVKSALDLKLPIRDMSTAALNLTPDCFRLVPSPDKRAELRPLAAVLSDELPKRFPEHAVSRAVRGAMPVSAGLAL